MSIRKTDGVAKFKDGIIRKNRNAQNRCVVRHCLRLESLEERRLLAVIGNNLSSGDELRNYRVAIAATAEYTAFHGGQAAAFAQIQNFVSDLNAIFEPELAIHLDLVSGTNTVFTNTATDGYTNGNVGAMLNENTGRLNTILGSAAYDIGHVFGTLIGAGGSGIAGLGVVGSSIKGQGATISSNPIGSSWTHLVAHEFGHQFGAEHTFNSNTQGSCGAAGQYEPGNGYEPGSGSTIMSYAGICGSDNLQSEGSDFFHSASFEQIATLISSAPALPNSVTPLSNSIPTVNGGADYTIPAGTPFELTAIGSDADPGDNLTYSWEQLDLGPPQSLPLSGAVAGPLFRVFDPVDASNRVFPNLPDLLANVNTASQGEVLPTITRDLNFRVTVRDGNGGINSDDVLISVINTGSNFTVTSPNTSTTWVGGSSQSITWNVAGTNGGAVGASNVDILLSTDGGLTYPFTLATTANDGSHTLNIPNIDTSQARIRVQGSGSIFFDVSDQNFTIASNASLPGLTFVQSGGDTRPIEGGADDSYTVALNTAPAGTVSIQLNADAQTLISVDGSAFASNVTANFTSTAPKTVTVRAIDDNAIEGPHTSVITHAVTSSTSASYLVGMALNNVVAHVYDDEDPPVVGVDFNFASVPTTPLGWTGYTIPVSFAANTLTNLVRDDGSSTPIDLTLQFGGSSLLAGSSSAQANDNTKPNHNPSIDNIDGFNFAEASSLTMTWSDLTPGANYGVYVFGLDGTGNNYGQNVTITGQGTPTSFTQVLDDNQLYVNQNIGSSSQTLVDSEIAVVANASGRIVIGVTPKAGSTRFSLAGVAIREIPEPVVIAPTVQAVVINGGDDQRSAVTSIEITFDSLVDVPDNAFSIINTGFPLGNSSTPVTGLIVNTVDGPTQTVTTITFGAGTSVVSRPMTSNTLADGNYRLDIAGALVVAEGGGPSMAADYSFGTDAADDFFRLYGDANGDGFTDFTDFSSAFLPSFGLTFGSNNYRDELDADGDRDVDFTDFATGFLPNFGTSRDNS